MTANQKLLHQVKSKIKSQFRIIPQSPTKIFVVLDGSDKEDLMVEIQRLVGIVNDLTIDYQMRGGRTRKVEYAFLNDRGNRADGFSLSIK